MDIAESYSKGQLPTETVKVYKVMMVELLEKIKKEIVEKEYA
jgi:hypothetical protein